MIINLYVFSMLIKNIIISNLNNILTITINVGSFEIRYSYDVTINEAREV